MDDENELMVGLVEGKMVHYVLDTDTRYPGAHRPALILNVFNKSYPGTSNLCVFMDGSNDFQEYLLIAQHAESPIKGDGYIQRITYWKTSVNYSEDKEPGTWHWIEEEE